MTAEITKRAPENFFTTKGNYVLVRVNLKGSVFNERVKHIHRHALIHIPIARLVLKTGKKELIAWAQFHLNYQSAILDFKRLLYEFAGVIYTNGHLLIQPP